jgi:hypothetical protein
MLKPRLVTTKRSDKPGLEVHYHLRVVRNLLCVSQSWDQR